MQYIESGVLCSVQNIPMMTSFNSTTKVRRKLFADTSPINDNKIKSERDRILKIEHDQFQAKYNLDLDNRKILPGNYEWETAKAKEVPYFYSKPYPAKTPESLKSHLMACVKDRDQILRNTFYRKGQFLSLAKYMTPCTGDVLKSVLPETPLKGATLSFRSTSCGTHKRKLSETDFNNVEDDCNNDNNNSPNSSSSPLRSHSPSSELSCESQESVGQILPNIPCSTTTDNEPSSQTSTQTLSLAQQDKQTRQTNITEFMKSQKNPSEPVAKHARRE